MEVKIPYDTYKDRTFFKSPSPLGTNIDIGNGIFAIMFHQDGHGPNNLLLNQS